MKSAFNDGTTHVVMSPLEFMQRRAALVPRPRLHLIRFHGVLAPNAKLRREIIPSPPQSATEPSTDDAPVRLSWTRLKLHNMPLAYHNGFFQLFADPVIEAHVASPFWALVSNSKYKNVETDILQAIDLYDTGGRDPAFYAAKALESMIKIICNEKHLITGKEKGAADFISHLNSKNNEQIIINDERDELLAMFRIRNTHGGHGPGNAEMPVLTNAQNLRYIHSVMIWVYSLSKR